MIAAQETGIDVTIVDSENVTAGERVLADLAIRLRDKGFGAKEIAAKLEEAKSTFASLAGSIRWNIYTAAAGSRKRARSRGHY